MKYVVCKSSRMYRHGPGYMGPSCERVGVEPGKVYDDFAMAQADAKKLSSYNPVGFGVEEYVPLPGEEKDG